MNVKLPDELAALFSKMAKIEKSLEISRRILKDNKNFNASEIFHAIAVRKDSEIKPSDLKNFLKEHGFNIKFKELNLLFEHLDKNSDGLIDWDEFNTSILHQQPSTLLPRRTSKPLDIEVLGGLISLLEQEMKGLKSLEKIKIRIYLTFDFSMDMLWDYLDPDEKGFIEEKDIQRHMDKYGVDGQWARQDVADAFARMDFNRDGKINYVEFKRSIRPNHFFDCGDGQYNFNFGANLFTLKLGSPSRSGSKQKRKRGSGKKDTLPGSSQKSPGPSIRSPTSRREDRVGAGSKSRANNKPEDPPAKNKRRSASGGSKKKRKSKKGSRKKINNDQDPEDRIPKLKESASLADGIYRPRDRHTDRPRQATKSPSEGGLRQPPSSRNRDPPRFRTSRDYGRGPKNYLYGYVPPDQHVARKKKQEPKNKKIYDRSVNNLKKIYNALGQPENDSRKFIKTGYTRHDNGLKTEDGDPGSNVSPTRSRSQKGKSRGKETPRKHPSASNLNFGLTKTFMEKNGSPSRGARLGNGEDGGEPGSANYRSERPKYSSNTARASLQPRRSYTRTGSPQARELSGTPRKVKFRYTQSPERAKKRQMKPKTIQYSRPDISLKKQNTERGELDPFLLGNTRMTKSLAPRNFSNRTPKPFIPRIKEETRNLSRRVNQDPERGASTSRRRNVVFRKSACSSRTPSVSNSNRRHSEVRRFHRDSSRPSRARIARPDRDDTPLNNSIDRMKNQKSGTGFLSRVSTQDLRSTAKLLGDPAEFSTPNNGRLDPKDKLRSRRFDKYANNASDPEAVNKSMSTPFVGLSKTVLTNREPPSFKEFPLGPQNLLENVDLDQPEIQRSEAPEQINPGIYLPNKSVKVEHRDLTQNGDPGRQRSVTRTAFSPSKDITQTTFYPSREVIRTTVYKDPEQNYRSETVKYLEGELPEVQELAAQEGPYYSSPSRGPENESSDMSHIQPNYSSQKGNPIGGYPDNLAEIKEIEDVNLDPHGESPGGLGSTSKFDPTVGQNLFPISQEGQDGSQDPLQTSDDPGRSGYESGGGRGGQNRASFDPESENAKTGATDFDAVHIESMGSPVPAVENVRVEISIQDASNSKEPENDLEKFLSAGRRNGANEDVNTHKFSPRSPRENVFYDSTNRSSKRSPNTSRGLHDELDKLSPRDEVVKHVEDIFGPQISQTDLDFDDSVNRFKSSARDPLASARSHRSRPANQSNILERPDEPSINTFRVEPDSGRSRDNITLDDFNHISDSESNLTMDDEYEKKAFDLSQTHRTLFNRKKRLQGKEPVRTNQFKTSKLRSMPREQVRTCISALTSFLSNHREIEKKKNLLAICKDFCIQDLYHMMSGSKRSKIKFTNMRQFFKKYNIKINKKQVEVLFERGDLNGDGLVDFKEFVELFCPFTKKFKAAMLKKKRTRVRHFSEYSMHTKRSFIQLIQSIINCEVSSELYRNMIKKFIFDMFDLLDKTQSGVITLHDLGDFLAEFGLGDTTIREVALLVRRFDLNKDGKISFDEFLNEMSPRRYGYRRMNYALNQVRKSDGSENNN